MADASSVRLLAIGSPGTQAAAVFFPQRGCTCVSATLEGSAGPISVVWAPDDFTQPAGRPTSGGIPILAPYPGRLASTTIEFEDRQYELEPRDTFGRPMHGFAHDRPWRLLSRSVDRFTAEFVLSRDAPERLDRWPADFRLSATWCISRESLSCTLELEALGRMPAGLGLHPYLPIPIRSGMDRERCELEIPATRWQPQKDMLPTGPLESVPRRVDFPGRTTLADMVFDDVFTGLTFVGKGAESHATAMLVDPSGDALLVEWTDLFSACVLFTPPHRQAVCIEPYSCLPGAGAFDERKGWRILEPSETLNGTMTLRLKECVYSDTTPLASG